MSGKPDYLEFVRVFFENFQRLNAERAGGAENYNLFHKINVAKFLDFFKPFS